MIATAKSMWTLPNCALKLLNNKHLIAQIIFVLLNINELEGCGASAGMGWAGRPN